MPSHGHRRSTQGDRQIRRRAEQERVQAVTYANTGFARDMLSVKDNLDRALSHIPGGAREGELKNFIERAMLLGTIAPPPARAAAIAAAPPPGLEELAPLHLPLKEARDQWTASFEAVYVRAVLKKTRGNVTHAAELAGVSRRFMQRLAARPRDGRHLRHEPGR